MPTVPKCPRCGGEVRPPGLWSSEWQCAGHGAVLPYTACAHVGWDMVDLVRGRAKVPVWAPVPAPPNWLVSGLGWAGDERTGGRATVCVFSGPSPLGPGAADLILVAEEPGIGLGARFAGLPGPDPGAGFDATAPDAKVLAATVPTVLWSLPVAADRAAFVGEAKGLWLWTVVRPAAAGVILYEQLNLHDLCERVTEVELGFGSVSPVLTEVPPVG